MTRPKRNTTRAGQQQVSLMLRPCTGLVVTAQQGEKAFTAPFARTQGKEAHPSVPLRVKRARRNSEAKASWNQSRQRRSGRDPIGNLRASLSYRAARKSKEPATLH
jgi:hypothetical protein